MRGEWGGTSGEGALVLRLGGGDPTIVPLQQIRPFQQVAWQMPWHNGLAGVLGKGGCLVLFGANV